MTTSLLDRFAVGSLRCMIAALYDYRSGALLWSYRAMPGLSASFACGLSALRAVYL